MFDATWGGFSGFGEDCTSTGAVKVQRAVIERPAGEAEYTFRLYEDFDGIAAAQLLFRAYHLTLSDSLAITLNGQPVPARGLKRRDDEVRVDLRPDDTPHDFARGAMTREQRPCVTYWFPLTADLCRRGENRLGLTLTASDPEAADSIVVEEVEVFVVPSIEHELPRRLKFGVSTSGTREARGPTATSPCPPFRERSWASSGPTAPARRRWSAKSPRSCSPRRERYACSASTRSRGRAR